VTALAKKDKVKKGKKSGKRFFETRIGKKLREFAAIYNEAKRKLAARKGLKFLICPNFIIYAAVLIFALVFTQALRSTLSGVFFVFMMLLPIVCLVHLLLSPLFIGASTVSSANEIYKMVPCGFSVKVTNEGIIPYPFTEAVIHVPDEHAVRSVIRRVWLSMTPRASYDVTQNVTFSYRGSYDIGVSCVYVYDIFRLFRLRLDFDSVIPVFVMPRRLTLDEVSQQAPSDINTDSSRNIIGVDRSELSDIRTYRIGDHMKTIHWQLSSKTQELMVKEFAMNSGKTVYIFADLNRPFDTSEGNGFHDDINEFTADGVVELTLAAASRELHEGNGVTLLWYDERVESGMQTVMLQTAADLNRMYKTFATAELNEKHHDLTRLASLANETQNASMLFVTGDLSKELYDGITGVASAFGNIRERGAIGVIYCDPSEKVRTDVRESFTDSADRIRNQLEANGISVTEPDMI